MTVTEDRPDTAEAPAKEVGRARRRKEDARLITGKTTWTDNMVLPGMLHIAVVRSPMAHAKIRSIDVEAARSAPGVVAVITGRTQWTDNLVLPGMLHLAIVRSPVAHAKIGNVDLEAARSAPGVIAVFSGRDFAEEQGSIPCAWPVTPDMVNPGHPSLAVDVHGARPAVGRVAADVGARQAE